MTVAKAHISGQVISEVEKRFTPNNTAVANFMIQVPPASRGRNAEPFQLKITCWSRLADAVQEQLPMGAYVVVEGKLTAPSVQQPDGSNKKSYELEASAVSMLPGPPQAIEIKADGGGYAAPQQAQPQPQPQYQQRVAAAAVAPQASAPPVAQAEQVPAQAPAFTEDDIPF